MGHRWSTVVIHSSLLSRGEIWQKLSNTEKMLRAQVISQQNTHTETQNVVTMCHINIFKNSIKIENIENIWYFRTKISDGYISDIYIYISMIYIGDIYRVNPASQTQFRVGIRRDMLRAAEVNFWTRGSAKRSIWQSFFPIRLTARLSAVVHHPEL